MKKILLVDDDESFVYLFKKKLEGIDFKGELERVSDGVAALAHITKDLPSSLPDHIFLDINMPVMDGFAFLREFRDRQLHSYKRVVITMVTSSVNEWDIKRSKEHGADYYLVKPVSGEELSTILKRG